MRNAVRLSSGGQGEWPAELPCIVSVTRITNDMITGVPAKDRLWGHLIDFDFYSRGQRVLLQVAVEPNALIISVNDDQVYEWEESPDDRPHDYQSVVAEMNRNDGKWTEQVNLQPGDEVVEDEDGMPTVIRDDEDVSWDDDEDVNWE